MFRKVLVANRGEIAIRAFRAAYELGAGTVAVFPHEDRNSLHRLKADESYEIGEPGHPVRAYLSVEEIIKAARKAGADAIYPGYGFLSENPELALACREAGHHVRRPRRRGAGADGQQGARDRRRPRGRAAGAGVERAVVGHRRSCSKRRRRCASRYSSRLSPVAAAAACAGSTTRRRCVSRWKRPARGRVGVRRPDRVPRAGRDRAAPHRGADPRRRRGQRDPPLRARLLRAAAPPEGDRDRARAEPSPPSCVSGCVPTR